MRDQMIHEIKGYKVLQGYRGQPAVSEDMLVDLLLNASRMGLDHADTLEAVDLNPIAVWGSEHRVLDAKVILRKTPKAVKAPTPARTQHVEKFFKGQAVAVVGASATPGKVGYCVLDSLVNYDYAGKVYPINPGKAEIMGKKCYPYALGRARSPGRCGDNRRLKYGSSIDRRMLHPGHPQYGDRLRRR